MSGNTTGMRDVPAAPTASDGATIASAAAPNMRVSGPSKAWSCLAHTTGQPPHQAEGVATVAARTPLASTTSDSRRARTLCSRVASCAVARLPAPHAAG